MNCWKSCDPKKIEKSCLNKVLIISTHVNMFQCLKYPIDQKTRINSLDWLPRSGPLPCKLSSHEHGHFPGSYFGPGHLHWVSRKANLNFVSKRLFVSLSRAWALLRRNLSNTKGPPRPPPATSQWSTRARILLIPVPQCLAPSPGQAISAVMSLKERELNHTLQDVESYIYKRLWFAM